MKGVVCYSRAKRQYTLMDGTHTYTLQSHHPSKRLGLLLFHYLVHHRADARRVLVENHLGDNFLVGDVGLCVFFYVFFFWRFCVWGVCVWEESERSVAVVPSSCIARASGVARAFITPHTLLSHTQTTQSTPTPSPPSTTNLPRNQQLKTYLAQVEVRHVPARLEGARRVR